MDPNLIKGHFFLGQALMETESYDEAIKHLQRGTAFYIIIFLFLVKFCLLLCFLNFHSISYSLRFSSVIVFLVLYKDY